MFSLVAFFILCAVAGVPLSWSKTAGGERLADWFTKWTSEVAASRTVHMRSFEEGLGRVRFVAGALEYERPFLCPLHRFMSLHPRDSLQTVPAYVLSSSVTCPSSFRNPGTMTV